MRAQRTQRGQGARVRERVRVLLGLADLSRDEPQDAQAATTTSLWRARYDPGRRAAIAAALAVVGAAIVTGWWVLSARFTTVPVNVSHAGPVTSSVSTSVRSLTASAPPPLVVDVAGKVRRPGLYRLSVGSRVFDAIKAAGGVLPGVNLSAINLAAKVSDGQQIAVGLAGVQGGGDSGGSGAGGTAQGGQAPSSGLIDLNAASPEQLQSLPGVGPVLAQHILDWRTEHGRFSSVDQLADVAGIGPVKFAALRGLVTA